jgi:hypothetical protein
MTNQVLFRKGQKGSLNAGIMALSKYVIHNGLCSGFPCFNMTIPHREGTPYPTSGVTLGSTVGHTMETITKTQCTYNDILVIEILLQ